MEYCRDLMDYIRQYPSNFHVIAGQALQLDTAGYERLSESQSWTLQPGGKYYVTRNGSSLIAFRIPKASPIGFMIMASHSDSPTLRIKPHPEIKAPGDCTILNIEGYGGGIWHTWFDRPLSVAGRIMVRTAQGVRVVPVNIDRDLLMIPSLAVHMNREVNKQFSINLQKDMLPLFSGSDSGDLMAIIAEEAGVDAADIISHELVLVNRCAPSVWGEHGEFLSAPRLDDVQCAFSSLKGFLEAKEGAAVPIHVVFDNEEVGSGTRQGAASTFLKDTLRRIATGLGWSEDNYHNAVTNSLMLSADNAHAVHPNYPEKADFNDRPVMGDGVVIKHAANQKYTTDAVSEALVRVIAEHADVQLQDFVNRADQSGGSTLGNISSTQVPVITADIGIAQLAMHSAYETCEIADIGALIALARDYYSAAVQETAPGEYSIIY